MKTLLTTVAAVLSFTASIGFGADQTFTGVISDSICKGEHQLMADQVSPRLSDADCARACVDAGAIYLFIDDARKALAITNQNFAGLKEHAAQKVRLTGEVKGESITVSRIESASAAK